MLVRTLLIHASVGSDRRRLKCSVGAALFGRDTCLFGNVHSLYCTLYIVHIHSLRWAVSRGIGGGIAWVQRVASVGLAA
jgi:hypothetical protein